MRFAVITLALVGCATDSLEPPTGKTVDYSVTRLGWPTKIAQASATALDINGDKTPDNQLGQVFASITERRIDVTGDTNALIQGGRFLVGANPITGRWVNSLITVN